MVRLSELLKACAITRYENIDNSVFVTGGNTDSRLILEGNIYFALRGQNSDGHDFVPQACAKNASVSIVDSSYKNDGNYPVIYSDNVENTLGEMAGQWRKFHNAKIIGITGTNGKTTTKEILGRILSLKYRIISTYKNYNNHIGVPLTLLSIKDDTEYAIVELGTNHFGEIEYLSKMSDPDMGLITNIGEGHLEQFGDRNGVYKEKIKLFELLAEKNGKIFVNMDDDMLCGWIKGDIITTGMSSNNKYSFSDISTDSDGYPSFTFRDARVKMNIPGQLNVRNALTAAAIAGELGISPAETASVLSTITLSDKRYETVGYKNAKVLLDCYNANPTSTEIFLKDLSLIESYEIVILGDMLELGATSDESHSRIIETASQLGFSEVLLTGLEMKKAFEKKEYSGRIKYYEDFQDLKKIFDEITDKGMNVAIKGSRGMKLEKLLD